MDQTKYLQLPDGVIAYDDTEGNGQPVLCLTLMGDLRQMYRFTRERLVKAGFRVITMDLRGLGESSVNWPEYTVPAMGRDVVQLVEHLQLKNVILIGESISASTAVWAAAEKPAYFAGLVVTGPFMRVMKVGALMKFAKKIAGTTPLFWGPFYKSLYKTRKPDDFAAYTKALAKNLREPGRYKATVAMFDAGHEETEARYAKVKAPALVVMGSKDPDFKDPLAEAEIDAQALHAQKVIIDGGGHVLPAEFPDEFSAAVIDFAHAIAK
jgi:pimeloyl-ACP methyl ester carboxylesterase